MRIPASGSGSCEAFAAIEYIKSLDSLKAASRLQIPSFHYYPAGESGYEMTESGRLLQSALKKSGVPAVFHLEPAEKPETDMTKLTATRFETIAAFLKKHL